METCFMVRTVKLQKVPIGMMQRSLARSTHRKNNVQLRERKKPQLENLSQNNKEEKKRRKTAPLPLLLLLVLENKKKTQGIIRIGQGKGRKEKTPRKKKAKKQNNHRASITTPCMVRPVRPAVVAALQISTPS